MLINLSNHPVAKWGAKQKSAAQRDYGQVVDLAFPQIDPTATLEGIEKLAAEYVERCLRLFGKGEPPHVVHVMGEMTFCYQFVSQIAARNAICVASTTERQVHQAADGKITKTFEFHSFRPYFQIHK